MPDKFDLDIFRTTDERIKMINDPDCPIEVMLIVAEHDLDQAVLEALWVKKELPSVDTPNGRKIRSILNIKLNGKTDHLDKLAEAKNTALSKKRYSAFCPIPWNHLATNADGSIRMCCQMIHDTKPSFGTVYKDDGNVLTGKDDITKHRNAPAWKQLRKDMLNGIDPKICKLCTDEEQNGIGSKRQWTKKIYEDVYYKAVRLTDSDGSIDNKEFPITYMDLRFGNKCNLKCRSCGPTDSSLWYDDWVAMRPDNPTFTYRDHMEVKIENLPDGTYGVPELFDYDQTYIKLWEHILNNLDVIKRYYFTGGEPTINLKHRELLDYYIDRGTANEVILDYNTNMAGVPSKVFNQWKYFKEVHVGMSIDGIYEHFEYIRHPGKFSTVEKNMRRLDSEEGFDRLVPSVTLTLSTMNVLHFLDMQWWMKEQNWKRINQVIIIHNLYGPEFLNIQNLPTDYKMYIDKRYKQYILAINRRWNITDEDKAYCKLVEIRLNSILTHMWDKEGNKEEFKRLWETTHQLDKIRNESWQVSMPEFEKMMKECNENRKTTVRLKVAGKK
tara:strand:+ start:10393 stop:12054 length:1662 start_codon:yes stop_codon:yes gene_type:complete